MLEISGKFIALFHLTQETSTDLARSSQKHRLITKVSSGNHATSEEEDGCGGIVC